MQEHLLTFEQQWTDEASGFNLQAATRVAANDKAGRERLCRYILRPPLANDRLTILDDGDVRLPADVPKLRPARPPPGQDREARGPEDYIN